MNHDEVQLIKKLLREAFDADEVDAELVNEQRGRYRFGVVSSRFQEMKPLERQDRIWEVIDQAVQDKKLSRDAMLEISLVLAYAPSELQRHA